MSRQRLKLPLLLWFVTALTFIDCVQGEQISREYHLKNLCSDRYLTISTTATRADADRLVPATNLTIESVGLESLVQIRNQLKFYLCFDHNATLHTKRTPDNKCQFFEHHTKSDRTEFRSSYRPKWFIGFDRTGCPISGKGYGGPSGGEERANVTGISFANGVSVDRTTRWKRISIEDHVMKKRKKKRKSTRRLQQQQGHGDNSDYDDNNNNDDIMGTNSDNNNNNNTNRNNSSKRHAIEGKKRRKSTTMLSLDVVRQHRHKQKKHRNKPTTRRKTTRRPDEKVKCRVNRKRHFPEQCFQFLKVSSTNNSQGHPHQSHSSKH